MTANIPYTSIFDGDINVCSEIQTRNVLPINAEGTEGTVGTVLDGLERSFHDVSAIVHRSGLLSLYSSNHHVTVFVPHKIIYDDNMSKFDAIQFCRNITCVRYLDRTALNYYGKFVLKTLATPYDLIIESFPNGIVTVNGYVIISSIKCDNGYIHVVNNQPRQAT